MLNVDGLLSWQWRYAKQRCDEFADIFHWELKSCCVINTVL